MTNQMNYEDADYSRRKALQNEQKMYENIRFYENKIDACSQNVNTLTKECESLSLDKSHLEKALKECEQIQQSELKSVVNTIKEASDECSLMFQSSIGELGILSVHEADIEKTQKDLSDIYQDISDMLALIKQRESELQASLSQLKNEISSCQNEINYCQKQKKKYAQEAQEYLLQMNRF